MSSLFWNFLKNPSQVGACCPSSPSLCHEITSSIGVENASLVVELGPGTGAITEMICCKMKQDALLAAVELNEKMAQNIEQKFSNVTVFRGCASELDNMLRSRQLPQAEIVISGLPFALFPDDLQEKILRSVVHSLAPGGTFATFTYLQGAILPAGIRFRRKLERIFPQVTSSPIVWKNIPPAFVYRCRKSGE